LKRAGRSVGNRVRAVSRDFDPEAGKWYEDLDREEVFKVVSVDPDDEVVKLQWLDGEIEEIDLDAWTELDLEMAEEPEGWADDDDDDEDDDWDDDEDDDWDDDDDEDEDDDDYDDDDDEYTDRE
jgi:hypothetical protein